jgi:FMN phosphatase YigB (HAD superfamily)
MRVVLLRVLSLVSTGAVLSTAFSPPTPQASRVAAVRGALADTAENAEAASSATAKTKTLGLLTFDLDDTLYPIEPVINEANAAFVRAMARYGYPDMTPEIIDETARQLREELAQTEGPAAAAILSHTEIRIRAIRREMEKVILKRKLQATADDWATPVEDLSNIVSSHAKRWATSAVSESVVQAVLSAWEMERHHSAERHLYTEVIDALKKIKEENPGVVIGAVTDGRANPMLMTFTLAPYFDFCMSWEDDQGGRSKFFQELSRVEGNADLKWIYNAAVEKYQELAAANAALNKDVPNDPNKEWIHVGDDLAYDIGGAAQCGAKTILVELADKYQQTARHRFEAESQPSWSTSSRLELEKRKILNAAAHDKADRTIGFLTRLPEAIDDILNE